MSTLFPNNIWQSVLVIILLALYSGLTVLVLENFTDHLGLKITINFLLSILFTLVTLVFINKALGYHLKFRFRIKNYRLLLISSLLVISFALFFYLPLNRYINSVFTFGGNQSHNPFGSLLLVFTTCVLSPILEEMIFRGVITKGLMTKYSSRFAIIASAVIFSVVHFSPSQIIGAFFYGLFFGWIYSQTKSIGYTIFLHFVANTIGLFSVYLNPVRQQNMVSFDLSSIYGNHTVPVLIISFIGFSICILLLVKAATKPLTS